MIKYKNEDGDYIDYQQTQMLENYTKIFFENDLPFKEIEIKGGNIFLEYIHNWNNESHQVLLAEYPEHIIIDHITYINGYYLEKQYSYDGNGNLVTHTHTLYDSYGSKIGYEMILDNEGGVFYDRMKYYNGLNYNPPVSSFATLYSNDEMVVIGVLFYNDHINIDGQDKFSLEANQINKFIQITGLSTELAQYYFSPEVIPSWESE